MKVSSWWERSVREKDAEFKAYLGCGQHLKEKDRREYKGIVMLTQEGEQTLLNTMVVLRTSLESRSLGRKNPLR